MAWRRCSSGRLRNRKLPDLDRAHTLAVLQERSHAPSCSRHFNPPGFHYYRSSPGFHYYRVGTDAASAAPPTALSDSASATALSDAATSTAPYDAASAARPAGAGFTARYDAAARRPARYDAASRPATALDDAASRPTGVCVASCAGQVSAGRPMMSATLLSSCGRGLAVHGHFGRLGENSNAHICQRIAGLAQR
jgi:hypothetical protein